MESILRDMRQSNVDQQILPSENEVIDTLLRRSVEMKSVYDELSSNLDDDQQRFLWDSLLGAATFWNPNRSKDLRVQKKTLMKVNQDIAQHASILAELMRQRYDLSETSGFCSHDDYHVLHWISRAAQNNGLYRSYVHAELERLSRRYDLKYWPRTFDVVDAVAAFAEEAKVHVTNDWTEELLSSQKCSKADYLRVLLKAIEDRKSDGPDTHQLPRTFRLTDGSLATVINCSLDLNVEDMVTAEYVKRARQNIRNQASRENG